MTLNLISMCKFFVHNNRCVCVCSCGVEAKARKCQPAKVEALARRQFCCCVVFCVRVCTTRVKSTNVLAPCGAINNLQYQVVWRRATYLFTSNAQTNMPLKIFNFFQSDQLNVNKKVAGKSTSNVSSVHGRPNEKESEAYFWIM